jgi:phosphoribosylformylglycinamidine cyclo-ligase
MSSENIQQNIGDRVSALLHNEIHKTWGSSVHKQGFGFRGASYRTAWETPMGIHSDGIGTKVIVAEALNNYATLGYDLVAMVCDDITAMGCVPFMMSTILDVGYIDEDLDVDIMITNLAKGLINAALEVDVPIMGGEFAQMGHRIMGCSPMPLIWNATGTWTCHLKSTITGIDIRPGDSIIALEEPGCRSNGFTLLRNLMKQYLGDNWWGTKCKEEETYGDIALRPSRLYTPIVRPLLHDDTPIAGMIHVTGGGLAGRLKHYLGCVGQGAHIFNPYAPNQIFQELIDENFVTAREAYENWSMGNGFLIITPEPRAVEELLPNIEHMVIGVVTRETSVTINPQIPVRWN